MVDDRTRGRTRGYEDFALFTQGGVFVLCGHWVPPPGSQNVSVGGFEIKDKAQPHIGVWVFDRISV